MTPEPLMYITWTPARPPVDPESEKTKFSNVGGDMVTYYAPSKGAITWSVEYTRNAPQILQEAGRKRIH